VTRTRFAPAPTGFLHLGHVLSATYVWNLARAHGAQVLLRIEDHDRRRSRPEYERALLDDLDWLGFVPDLYPTSAFRAGPCESRQSDRGAVYESAAARLISEGLVYACDCSRSRVGDAPYPGTCRDRSLPLEVGLTWRVRIDPGVEAFDDLLMGKQAQDPASQCGDVPIRDRLGQWTYQFAVVVDDAAQGIDLVVRGADLLDSTGRQIRLARLLGRATPPAFAHHPLIMKSATQKLSKSDGDTAVRALRETGWTAEQVREAARASGATGATGDS
jgi:glutamyl-tRNA synthetase/glutamyl-Q tRNA(Asp) synthetase